MRKIKYHWTATLQHKLCDHIRSMVCRFNENNRKISMLSFRTSEFNNDNSKYVTCYYSTDITLDEAKKLIRTLNTIIESIEMKPNV